MWMWIRSRIITVLAPIPSDASSSIGTKHMFASPKLITAAITAVSLATVLAVPTSGQNANLLWYDTPAQKWEQALALSASRRSVLTRSDAFFGMSERGDDIAGETFAAQMGDGDVRFANHGQFAARRKSPAKHHARGFKGGNGDGGYARRMTQRNRAAAVQRMGDCPCRSPILRLRSR